MKRAIPFAQVDVGCAYVLLPRPNWVASLIKRWLLGTQQGAVNREKLDYYLDEYTFRPNQRTSKVSDLLFHRLGVHAAPPRKG